MFNNLIMAAMSLLLSMFCSIHVASRNCSCQSLPLVCCDFEQLVKLYIIVNNQASSLLLVNKNPPPPPFTATGEKKWKSEHAFRIDDLWSTPYFVRFNYIVNSKEGNNWLYIQKYSTNTRLLSRVSSKRSRLFHSCTMWFHSFKHSLVQAGWLNPSRKLQPKL